MYSSAGWQCFLELFDCHWVKSLIKKVLYQKLVTALAANRLSWINLQFLALGLVLIFQSRRWHPVSFYSELNELAAYLSYRPEHHHRES